MDFFAAQEQARRQTRLLLLLFAIAIGSLILITNLAVAVTLWWLGGDLPAGQSVAQVLSQDLRQPLPHYFSWQNFGTISLLVCGAVGLVMLFKWLQLRAGGKRVAEAMGGTRLNPATENPAEKQLLNVVEEMALAAGMPVPAVYLMQGEKGINAFAAGFNPADAVIGITRGALEQLDREQLQGVVAHEFSHILNGDMRLNMRLIIVLAGMLFLSLVGRMLLQSGGGSGMGVRRRGDARLAILGLLLIVLGWLGSFFGGLIKAAVSRQREYLADAAAVQFTRNPAGLAGALKIIGGYSGGSRVFSAAASEASHLFISDARSALADFATHPPLADRIRKLEPGWDGQFIERAMLITPPQTTTSTDRGERAAQALGVVAAVSLAGDSLAPAALADLPLALQQQTHDSFGAVALCFALLLHKDQAVASRQLQHIGLLTMPGMTIQVQHSAVLLTTLREGQRLPLLELALPALKNLSENQYKQFKRCLLLVIRADQEVELFEWCLYQLIRHQLDTEFGLRRPLNPAYDKLEQVAGACQQVLSLLAYQDQQVAPEVTFKRGAEYLNLGDISLLSEAQCHLDTFIEAVNQLARCYPMLKPKLLKALTAAASENDQLNPRQRELISAIAVVLDCPAPPALIAIDESAIRN